jgi:hypothetical protein
VITFIKGIFRDNFLIFAVLFFAVLFIIVLSLGDTKKVANAHIVETPTVEGEVMVVEQLLANIAIDKVSKPPASASVESTTMEVPNNSININIISFILFSYF